MPLLGAHVSTAGGLHHAPENAAALKLDTFQFFTRPPQTGRAEAISAAETESFLDDCHRHGLRNWHVHAPYIINLASADSRIVENSIRLLREELERADLLQSKSVIAHVGSASGVGKEKGLEMVADGIRQILNGYTGKTLFSIETTAGSGNVLCSRFEEIAEVIKMVGSDKVAVCLDTAHVFAAGYDLGNKKVVKRTIDEFDATIGLKHLTAIHLNDSKVGLGSRKDRHEHLGYGHINPDGMMALLTDRRLDGIEFEMETPNDDRRPEDVSTARRWLSGELFIPKARQEPLV